MASTKRGSIFLLTLTLMTMVFILAFAFTFFTGSEDYSAAMSYESEVAFNLAESAIEEFVARLKCSLNHDDSNNKLYKVLRAYDLDVSKEIPIDQQQMVNLTSITREVAQEVYGYQFGRGLSDSKDFIVEANLKLDHINAVEATSGETVLYKIKKDTKEKQGNLTVTATVNYKGHEAKVSLTFLIRVVKTFVPPFNYFTFFVRDASVVGGSDFNVYGSTKCGINKYGLRLDNGWKFINPDFDPTNPEFYKGTHGWEDMLSRIGEEACTPPGRVFLGQDLDTMNTSGGQSSVIIRSTNGQKLLFENDIDTNEFQYRVSRMNGQENPYLLFDVPWTGMKDYVKKFMELQGQEKTTKRGTILSLGGLLVGWNNKNKLRIFNVGSDIVLNEGFDGGTPPSFYNCFHSYVVYTQKMIDAIGDETEKELMKRFVPEVSYSGFHPFGTATVPDDDKADYLQPADFYKLSPTLIYGPAQRQYFRAVEFKINNDDKKVIQLPYVSDEAFDMLIDPTSGKQLKEDDKLTASQAKLLFDLAGVDKRTYEPILNLWEDKDFPKELHEFEKYKNFMSDSGSELYNKGLANFLDKIKKDGIEEHNKKGYEGVLKDFMNGYLESYPYPYGSIPEGMNTIISQCPVREYYEGPISYAMPNAYATYLYDFYFIPRCTEDFFRGRTTVAIGGKQYDRFVYKYIDNPQTYGLDNGNHTMELNGILALNDSDPLLLDRLKYRGNGIIYSSPMMGGGKVVINGDLLCEDTDVNTFDTEYSKNMLTIIAPQIYIDTSKASGNRCYIEANLISTSEPLIASGTKPITVKGTVVTPYFNLKYHFPNLKGLTGENENAPVKKTADELENVIIYNPMNGIWRNEKPDLLDQMYVAKIVTGGVGKFEWKFER